MAEVAWGPWNLGHAGGRSWGMLRSGTAFCLHCSSDLLGHMAPNSGSGLLTPTQVPLLFLLLLVGPGLLAASPTVLQASQPPSPSC
jgi:hypothetical protein